MLTLGLSDRIIWNPLTMRSLWSRVGTSAAWVIRYS
jgi:hypothetical protein